MEKLLNAFAKSHIVFFTFIAVSTEILSGFHMIDLTHLRAAWGLFCLSGLLAVLFVKQRRRQFSFPEILRNMSPLSIFLCSAIAFTLAMTFATGILYPPNNWDSMTYHMARVEHWISDKSVSFYPTAIVRQNYQLPLAEFTIMHLQVLTRSDLLANLVQWICFLVSIVIAALIAAELDLDKKQQLISAAIVAAIPMAILQSSSTQNDLVVSSFTMSFALFMLRLRKDFGPGNLLFAGLSLGLALLTKGTAYIYCAAMGTTLAMLILLKAKSNHQLLIRVTAGLSLVVLIALVLNGGYYLRSYGLYGAPISSGEASYFNQDISTLALLSNIPRNLALHLGTPSSYFNWYVYRTMQLALGHQLYNPGTTCCHPVWPAHDIVPYSNHEDNAGNLIHMLVTFFALASALVWAPRQPSQRNWYAVGLLLAGCLYCLALRWQPWASRLHTPLFALSAPVLTIALTQYTDGAKRYVAYAVIVLMVLYSFIFVLDNRSRSLLSLEWKRTTRMKLYFQNRPKLYDSYSEAMHVLEQAHAQDVGLYIEGDDWEYPFWAFAKESFRSDIRFRHVGVNNQSRILQSEAHLPTYVLATVNTDTWPKRQEYSVVYVSAPYRECRTCIPSHVSVLRRLSHSPG